MASPTMKAATPNQLPPAELFDEMFVVKLMKGRKIEARFTLHKGVAAFSSDYFEAATKRGTFKEGKNSCVELADVDKRNFSQLVAWMYHRTFDDYDDAKSLNGLTSLFILADRLLVPFLGNILINRMHDKAINSSLYSPQLVVSAYKDMPEGSGLRKFAVDLWVRHDNQGLVEHTKAQGWDSEILCDVMQAMYEDRAAMAAGLSWHVRYSKMDKCRYHSHKDGERCPS